jgi:tetratricopeptide (TPR) repeat protein
MNTQIRQFLLFIIVVALGTSFAYRALNQNSILLHTAKQHFSRGQYTEAATVYQKILSRGFQSTEVYEGLIACHTSLKNPDQVRLALKALLSDNKVTDPAQIRYFAATALGMGLQDIAASEYRKVLSLRPDDRSARLGLARALARAGLYEEAVKEYRLLLGEIK